MPCCALKDCSSHSRKLNKSQGVTFHRFPRHGHEKRDVWIKFVQKNRKEATWLPSDHTSICSLHFKEEDKKRSKAGRIYLDEAAVPHVKKALVEPEPSGLLQPKVEPLSESELVSDSESIFDSPKEIVLKHRLLKETIARKRLAVKFKKAERQNRYLKKKCESYKNVIKALTQNCKNLK